MKKKIMSIILTIVLIISLVGCGTNNTAVAEQTSSSAIAESTAESLAGSEAEEETNPWLGDVDAYHKRLEAAGLHWKLNDDGSKPEEWTVEYYEGEEYAGCDGVTLTQYEGLRTTISSSLIYNVPNIDALDYFDLLPEEQRWAMSTADFKRAAPNITPPTDEDFIRFKEEAQKYVESRGAGEYPIHFCGYNFKEGSPTSSIVVSFIFINNNRPETDSLGGIFNCQYSTKDYSNQGYTYFKESLDSVYGDGTYQSIHDKLIGKDTAGSTATSTP